MAGPQGLQAEIDASPQLLLRLASQHPDRYPLLLDSASAGPLSRQHLLLRTSGQYLQRDAEGKVGGNRARPAGNFFEQLQDWYRERALDDKANAGHWSGGWAVYVGYETAADIERRLRLPECPESVSAYAAYCPVRLRAEAGKDRIHVEAEADHEIEFDATLADIQAMQGSDDPPAAPLRIAMREDPPSEYLGSVALALQHIAAGDIYQANLSRAWRGEYPQEQPSAIPRLYRQLRAANPAPFASLLQIGRFAILSSSPERMIAVDGRTASTRPIAGTRPRTRVASADAAEIAALIAHPKERAEHIMLIDLERNDLGKVCLGGSVEVDEFLTVESYQHVHHIVSSVRGQLRPEVTPIDALRAVFPGGTITGVPKFRCMQIIAALEGGGRGAYTGSLGYLGRDGRADFNILIRSIVIDGGRIGFRAGAGIVADSDAQRELEETRAKARGMLAALDPGA